MEGMDGFVSEDVEVLVEFYSSEFRNALTRSLAEDPEVISVVRNGSGNRGHAMEPIDASTALLVIVTAGGAIRLVVDTIIRLHQEFGRPVLLDESGDLPKVSLLPEAPKGWVARRDGEGDITWFYRDRSGNLQSISGVNSDNLPPDSSILRRQTD